MNENVSNTSPGFHGRAFIPRPAQSPTNARPGSEEKIAVLAARLAAREELYHPDDESIPIWTPCEDYQTPVIDPSPRQSTKN